MAATKVNTAEEDRERADEPDGPLIDSVGATVKKMIARGKERGYVTYDEINAALARYCGVGAGQSDVQSTQIFVDGHAVDQYAGSDHGNSPTDDAQDVRPSVCFVTDDDTAVTSLRSLFERDGYRIDIRMSSDFGLADPVDTHCEAVFINCAIGADHLRFVERVRRVAPQAQIRFYSSPIELLIRPGSVSETSELLVSNLELFSTLLAINGDKPSNRGSRIGRLTERLCRQMGLNEFGGVKVYENGKAVLGVGGRGLLTAKFSTVAAAKRFADITASAKAWLNLPERVDLSGVRLVSG
ncbi:MAG: hypothetical protein IIB67_13525, partial [Proteobacteria bacterium]|nr:hypothetical protein [Pseudomonadota bacterium]